ncbi:hypothetical protein SLEP1_g8802 [Rubroshorea leprosula]|uniref:Uncharacterized protein n=1 Tax=Rubroshorea leprosula TaxID=152421 RepID=A0AAV5IDT9_9ROSI|nr:hypothetical protein SLEP1_g8802 [Rubroshorea leprosula]
MNNHEFSFSHPLIIFSVFNTIIVASIVGSRKSPVHVTEGDLPFFSYWFEVEGAYESIIKVNHKEEEKEVLYSITLVWRPVLAILVVSIAAILVLILNNHGFSFSHPLIIFSVFNTIIVASIVGSDKSPVHETERDMPFFSNLHEVEGAYDPIIEENHKEEEEAEEEKEEEEAEVCISNGYHKDDHDNGGDDDGDGYDENLERKVEAFINKVTEEWRKEKSMENEERA